MSNKTITVVEFIHYDGKHTCKDHMYFETKLRAERYLKGNGYEPDGALQWKKDDFYSAKTIEEPLHLGDGEQWRIVDTKQEEEWTDVPWTKDPDVQDFLERQDAVKKNYQEYGIYTAGGLTNDKEGSFMKWINKIMKRKNKTQ